MGRASDQKDVLLYVGNESPMISRSLSTITGAYELPDGTTYRLMVRQREGSDILLDQPMQVEGDIVFYEPEDGDFEDQGYYKAWVRIQIAGNAGVVQDVEEFNLFVFDHAPGKGVRTGAVAMRARRKAPVAWDALRSYSEYGDPGLQDVVELTKLRVLPSGMVITAAQEVSLDLRVCNYLALLVAIEVIKAAIDYWTSRAVGENLQAPNEATTYPDRIAAALKLIEVLERDLPQAKAEAEAILGVQLGTVSTGGIAMVGGGEPITPGLSGANPWDFGYPVDPYGRSRDSYPWWCE